MTTAQSVETRERLLEAAGTVFGERGFKGATVRAICLQAGVNVAAVNYHFGDKETLYREALRFAFQRSHSKYPLPQREGLPTPERLRGFVEALLQRLFSAGRSWHGQIMAREFADPTEALSDAVHRFMEPMLGTLDEIIGDACPALTAEQRRLHAFSLLGQCVFFRHARPVLDRLFGPESYGASQIPELTEHIVSVFLRGLQVRESE